MKFYVPFTIGVSQAEQIYAVSKKRLDEIGFRVSARRIKSLSYWVNGQLVCQQVGDQAANGEIIAAIFESDVGYFISTYTANKELAEPLGVRYSMLIMRSTVEHIDRFDQE
ncbi:hypothetical protein GCM10028808_04420 [Spirosoma migulaei]